MVASVDASFERVLQEATKDDGDAYWKAIDQLRSHPAEKVWEKITPLAHHPDPQLQALVPDVLRYFPERTEDDVDRTVALLGDMLATPRIEDVIASIAAAFVDLRRPAAAVDLMLPFVGHPSAEVRRCVVHALLGAQDPRAVAALITLSSDDDPEIRDWATFGLGSQLGEPGAPDFVDGPTLRDALAARLDDTCDDARAEAIVGLAMRKDPRAVPAIAKELSGGPFGSLVIEAARWAADPALCKVLRSLASDAKLVEEFDEEERQTLAAALDACCKA
ncbi:MAG: HEAT repeat domain-containing protein [Deltaproteobacteria bacterium]|nr:HEAT repeat domain-containing protein [Deltaproteobacteria bacterium]